MRNESWSAGEEEVRRPSSLADRPPIGERELIWMMALLMALNAFGIDAILPALDELARDLAIPGNSRQFVIGAYLLAAGLGTLVPGAIADRYGRRPVLFVALAAYIALSIACALAASFEALVALRAAQGFCAAGIVALPPAIIRDRVGGDRMARMMSLIFVIFLLVPAIAPSIGQGVIELFGDWRWIFAVMAGAGLAMTGWVYHRLPETLHAEDRQEIRLARIVRNMTSAVTLRETIGYTLGSALVFGGLFGFINSSQQLIGEAFGAGGLAMTGWVYHRLPETLHAEDRQEIRLARIVRNMTSAVTLRETIGYTLGSALVFGGLFGFINSSQQLIGEAFGAGDAFPLIFAICAACMAASNWSNSRIVEKFGARRVSHAALFVFIAVAAAQLWFASQPDESLWTFVPLMAANMSLLGFIGANFGSIALQPFRHIAGAASSAQGFLRMTSGAALGAAIGYSYDGTARPLALALLVTAVLSLAFVLFSEKGELFGPPVAGDED